MNKAAIANNGMVYEFALEIVPVKTISKSNNLPLNIRY
jgi:hypothetical protein